MTLKNNIPVVEILGVKIAAINMDYLMKYTEENLGNMSGDYICASNVHTTVMSYENKEYRDVQNNALMAIPDGGPLCVVGKKRGAVNMSRTTGPDYMGEAFKKGIEKGWKHYFYGSTQENLDTLRAELEKKYPGIRIAGMYSPPFRKLTPEEDSEVIKMINEADPDFVWICLGAPKQENWAAEHKGKVKGLMVGVGAAFNFFSGKYKRAPKWMQDRNLEWLYRLLQDPKRLFTRYLVTNTKFILHAVILRK